MMEVLHNALIGALGGASFALSGYLKSEKGRFKKIEEFDSTKFLKTMMLGAIIGAVSGGTGLEYQTTVDYLVSMGIYGGLTGIIENIAKAISRRLFRR